jgi:hypothetical protein
LATRRIAIDASWVYWSTPGSSSPGLFKAPIGGGAGIELTKVMRLPTPRSFAVDSVAIYWADGANFYRLAL